MLVPLEHVLILGKKIFFLYTQVFPIYTYFSKCFFYAISQHIMCYTLPLRAETQFPTVLQALLELRLLFTILGVKPQ